jgi:CheY-like chemotaxis protein
MIETIRRKKVMIIDDSEIVLTVAQRTLESAGFDVVTHPRPTGCIALILRELPDVLLVDVNMPGLNGDTVVRMLGSTQVNAQMVVLLHSSLQDDVLARKAKASKAHGYIRKTESPQDLVREVSRWVRSAGNSGAHRMSLDSISSRSSSGTMLAGSRVSDSPDASAARIEGPAPLVKKLLLVDHDMIALSEFRHLTKSLSESVEYALSGVEALRRLQSERAPDVVMFGRLIGSPNLEEVLRGIERMGARWKSRCIVLHDEVLRDLPSPLEITRLRRPVTEAALCKAVQACLQRAS